MLITLLISAVVFALLLPGWLSVGRFDILILAVAIAPFALLKQFHINAKQWGNPQSVLFTKYNSLFSWLSFVLLVVLFYGLYKYVLIYGVWKTLAVFLLGSLIQAPFYAFLKMRIGMEILLYPLGLLATILFFVVAL